MGGWVGGWVVYLLFLCLLLDMGGWVGGWVGGLSTLAVSMLSPVTIRTMMPAF